MRNREELDGVLERRVIHQDVVEDQAMVIAADEAASKRRGAHDQCRDRDKPAAEAHTSAIATVSFLGSPYNGP